MAKATPARVHRNLTRFRAVVPQDGTIPVVERIDRWNDGRAVRGLPRLECLVTAAVQTVVDPVDVAVIEGEVPSDVFDFDKLVEVVADLLRTVAPGVNLIYRVNGAEFELVT